MSIGQSHKQLYEEESNRDGDNEIPAQAYEGSLDEFVKK